MSLLIVHILLWIQFILIWMLWPYIWHLLSINMVLWVYRIFGSRNPNRNLSIAKIGKWHTGLSHNSHSHLETHMLTKKWHSLFALFLDRALIKWLCTMFCLFWLLLRISLKLWESRLFYVLAWYLKCDDFSCVWSNTILFYIFYKINYLSSFFQKWIKVRPTSHYPRLLILSFYCSSLQWFTSRHLYCICWLVDHCLLWEKCKILTFNYIVSTFDEFFGRKLKAFSVDHSTFLKFYYQLIFRLQGRNYAKHLETLKTDAGIGSSSGIQISLIREALSNY